MSTTRRGHILKRHSQLELEAAQWVPHWRELSTKILPRTGRFLTTDRQAQGNKRVNDILDNTAAMALRTLVSGMMSGITSPARPWFQFRIMDRALNNDRAVRWWLDQARDVVADLKLKSNFYTVVPGQYQNLGLFGTSAQAVVEDSQSIVRYVPFPVGSFNLGLSDTGRPDTCYRKYQMSVAQLVHKFGKENCPSQIQRSYETGTTETYHDVLHVIEPNVDWDEQRVESRFKRYASIYLLLAGNENDDTFLRASGFDDFPIVAPRWEVEGEDTYGTSPGMVALSDIKQLQLMQRRKLQGLDKLVAPPLKGPVSLKNRKSSFMPNDITYVDEVANGQRLEPIYQVQLPLGELAQEIMVTQNRINDGFFKELFLMISQIDTGVTATEIAARQEEKLMMLGPVYLRLNDEMLDPLVELTMKRAEAAGILPPPPEKIIGAPLQVEYVSVMAQTMKSLGVASIDRLMTFVGTAAPVFPSVLDKVNIDATVDHYADMVGTPANVLYGQEEVAASRAAKERQAMMQQGMAMAAQGASAAKDASAAMGGGDALGALLSNMQGAPLPPVPGVQ
jgi:hypothetical protein